jgi:hypothetical protein
MLQNERDGGNPIHTVVHSAKKERRKKCNCALKPHLHRAAAVIGRDVCVKIFTHGTSCLHIYIQKCPLFSAKRAGNETPSVAGVFLISQRLNGKISWYI